MDVTIGRNEIIVGKFDESEIEGLLAKGEIRHDDLYWHEGMTDWIPIHTNWGHAKVEGDGGIPREEVAQARKLGLFGLLGGGVLFWLCVIGPIKEASNGADSVSISFKSVFLIPLLLFFGVAYLFTPRIAIRMVGLPQEPTKGAWRITIPLIILGALFHCKRPAECLERGFVGIG